MPSYWKAGGMRRVHKKNPLTLYICWSCKKCKRIKSTHPGQNHDTGICDCLCRD